MYNRSTNQLNPAKQDVLYAIDSLYRKLYGRPVPNMISVGNSYHISDLENIKLQLQLKLAGPTAD